LPTFWKEPPHPRFRAARKVLEVRTGVMGLILFRWTPKTGRGICLYLGLLALVVLIALVMAGLEKRNGGYWPEKPA
jgi:hypothetical protein